MHLLGHKALPGLHVSLQNPQTRGCFIMLLYSTSHAEQAQLKVFSAFCCSKSICKTNFQYHTFACSSSCPVSLLEEGAEWEK